MIKETLFNIGQWLDLTEALPETLVQGISIDTRTLQPGNLFIALAGTQTDGHQFIETAKEKGASAALVTQNISSTLPLLIVPDAIDALGKIATNWRQQFQLPIVAVTGSNGKTTVKNMISAIMLAAVQGNAQAVLATRGTLNNHLGLPLTLSQLNHLHRYAIVEMGMNHFGEIAALTAMARPNVAIITNAAESHLEGVGGTKAGVAKAKAEIFSGLTHDGMAILNRDDDYFDYWVKASNPYAYLTFGLSHTANIYPSSLSSNNPQQITIHTPIGEIELILPLLGKHNIQNALAATAACVAVGIDLHAIKLGLESVQTAPGRLQIHTLPNGVNIIDDTYNANPFSLNAAIQTLMHFHGKRILVLGDMKELGEQALTLHQLAGKAIRDATIDYLFTYGELSEQTSRAFGEGAYHFKEHEKLLNAIKPLLQNTTTILIKGSRSMKMEKIVAELI